jgi:hypothetical protein
MGLDGGLRYAISQFWFHNNMCGPAQFGTDSIFPYQYHHHQQVSTGDPCYYNSDGSHYIHGEGTQYLYKRVELGVLGGIALQKRIFQSYTVSLGARYELGLTDIENPKEDKDIITFGGLTGSDGLPDPRSATHNRRLVLDIGVSRIIE